MITDDDIVFLLICDVLPTLLCLSCSVISNLQESVQRWDGGLKHLIEKVECRVV